MYTIVFTSQMKHDAKVMRKRGKDLSKLTAVLDMLSSGEPLPQKYRDHQLTGNYHALRECHIEPDWLLVYRIIRDKLVLSASGTGTHSDLFG